MLADNLIADSRISQNFLDSVLNSMTAHIAVIDTSGVIIAVNESWRRFAAQNNCHASDLGRNYLAICESAPDACEGIRDVLQGVRPDFHLDYPCHSAQQQHWFEMSVTPLGTTVQYGAVIAHTNITERHVLREALLRDTVLREQEAIKLSAALDRLRSLTASSEILLVNERKRIAHELHDEFGQLLTALRLNISTLKTQYSPQLPDLIEQTTQMQEVLNQAFSSMRGIVSNLRPPALNMGLIAALEWLRDDFNKMFNIPCTLVSSESFPDLSEVQLSILFRITQELLSNAAQHARASFINITVQRKNNAVQLSVQDNGVGFDQDTARRKPDCFGLFGMQERILALGGELLIDTAHGMGSCVTINIPLTNAQAGLTTTPEIVV